MIYLNRNFWWGPSTLLHRNHTMINVIQSQFFNWVENRCNIIIFINSHISWEVENLRFIHDVKNKLSIMKKNSIHKLHFLAISRSFWRDIMRFWTIFFRIQLSLYVSSSNVRLTIFFFACQSLSMQNSIFFNLRLTILLFTFKIIEL